MASKTLGLLGLAFVLGVAPASACAAALHDAIRAGDATVVARLLAAGADREQVDESGLTPMVTAALAGHDHLVRLLIESGADPRGRDANGFTALHAAAHAGHPAVAERLIAHGADVDDQANTARISPLHASAERNHLDVARLLLRHGVTVEVRSGTGHTPLVMATLKEHPQMVRLLREHGADCGKMKFARFREYCENAGL